MGRVIARTKDRLGVRPIATVEHQVGALCCFKLGVRTVLSDQQFGGAPNVDVQGSRRSRADRRSSREEWNLSLFCPPNLAPFSLIITEDEQRHDGLRATLARYPANKRR